MSIPPYIPGTIALGLSIAAALTPADADGLTEVGFLRWAAVAGFTAGGALGWRINDSIQKNTAAVLGLKQTLETKLDSRFDKDHELITEIARESLRP